MTLDNQGNLYLTRKGITIFNRKGEQITHIAIPENYIANLCLAVKKEISYLLLRVNQIIFADVGKRSGVIQNIFLLNFN